MQTQEPVTDAESPLYRLKSGEHVSRYLVNKVLRLKHEENGGILFNDLVMRCQDDLSGNHLRIVYFDGSLRRLAELAFLDDDWTVPHTIREIALDLAR